MRIGAVAIDLQDAAKSCEMLGRPRMLAVGRIDLASDTTAPGTIQFRDDPPLVRVIPPSPATNATANLDAPSRRGSVNYMVDHICEPMPSTGSHLPNYAARCKMGERHRLQVTDRLLI